MRDKSVTHGKCLPQFCFRLFPRNITEITKIVFCGHTTRIYFPNFVSSNSGKQKYGKKIFDAKQIFVTRVLKKRKIKWKCQSA